MALLKEWLPGYLCECERKVGAEVGSTPWPKGWAITGRDLEKYVSDQLPCVVVMAGGVTTRPRVSGSNGSMTGVWDVDIGIILNAAWGYMARWQAQLYERASPSPWCNVHSCSMTLTSAWWTSPVRAMTS